MSPRPTSEEALQFALMCKNGYPTKAAIQYFYPDELDLGFVSAEHDRWVRSKAIRDAIKLVQSGQEWAEMEPSAQIQFAITKHYAEMAYFLYANNYAEIEGSKKIKADTCRIALEAHLAGTSGKLTAYEQWLSDITKSVPRPALVS